MYYVGHAVAFINILAYADDIDECDVISSSWPSSAPLPVVQNWK